MAALIAGERARMYALGNVARGGATRGAYHSPKVFVALDGVQYATGRGAGAAQVDADSLTITDVRGNTANTCQFTARGFTPHVGQAIVITLGSINSLTREFGGVILSLDAAYLDTPANTIYTVRGIDPSWLANQRLISGSWANVSASAIAAAILPLGYTGAHIQAALPGLDVFSYVNQTVTAVIAALVARFAGTAYFDYLSDLHVFATADPEMPTDPTPLTPTHPTLTAFQATPDLSQIVTRCFVEGLGSTTLATIAAGATSLPVAASAPFVTTGGLVAVAGQRLSYTGVQAGTAAPNGLLTVDPQDGGSITAGAHSWAFTWVTGAGETLPSPLASYPIGAIATPGAVDAVVDHWAGTGPAAGTILYALMIGSDDLTAQTVVGPTTSYVAVGSRSLTVNFTQTAAMIGLTCYICRSDDGGTTWYALAGVTTPVGTVSAANFLIDSQLHASGGAPVANAATATDRVTLGALAIGPAGVTARKVYQTAVGQTALLLAATVADNTSLTVVITGADGSLGAAAPTSDTSGLTGFVGLATVSTAATVGATSLILSTATPFAPSGWVVSGSQILRYTGIAGSTLTGIPATGQPGAITNLLSVGDHVDQAAALTGIPASGAGAVTAPILVGAAVNVLAQVDDLAAQATLSALLDPTNVYSGARGIQETYLTSSTDGAIEAHARGLAELALRKLIDVQIAYTCRDMNTRAGRTIAVALPLQGVPSQAFKIAQVDQAGFVPAIAPTYTVTAGARFSFEYLLRSFGG